MRATTYLKTGILSKLRASTASVLESWYWRDVLFPFLAVRLALVLAVWFFVGTVLPNPTYAEDAAQGGLYSRFFLIDIWSHWDTGFYLRIIKEGYQDAADITRQMTSLAFFPLYPYLVKGIGWLGIRLPDSAILLSGLLLSNGCFLAAAAIIRRLAVDYLGYSELAVGRGLRLMIAFPSAFFFSTFYPESLFLFLTAAGFAAGVRRKWALAALCAALVTLARPQGVIVTAALAWLYMESRDWKLRAVRLDALWFVLAPLGVALHLWYLYGLTGEFLAPIKAQLAWGRGQYGLFEGLRLQLEAPVLDVYKVDAVIGLVFLACAVFLLSKKPVRALGVYSLLMVLVPVSSGMLISLSRFLVVIFPVFLLLGEKLERRELYELLLVIWFAFQVLYFTGWVHFYWIA